MLVEIEPEGLFLSDKVLRLVVDEDAKKWVLWFLRSALGRKQIEDMATGNQLSMRNISQQALHRILLPFPTEEIRRRLIAKIDVTFTRATHLEAEAARAHALLNRLESAILAKAFRGELVLTQLPRLSNMIFSNAREPGTANFSGCCQGGQTMTGSPWELTLVLLLSATVFLSLSHFVARVFG